MAAATSQPLGIALLSSFFTVLLTLSALHHSGALAPRGVPAVPEFDAATEGHLAGSRRLLQTVREEVLIGLELPRAQP